MKVFMICVVAVFIGLVLAGEAFKDQLVLMPSSQTYSRDFLLSQIYKNYAVHTEIPSSICLHKRRRSRIKKRGSRGGIRNRLQRRGSHHPLLVVTLSNVRFLNNKMDEVALQVKQEEEFRRCNLICFMEMWLNEHHSVDTEGFTTIQADRDKVKLWKSVGRELCMYVDMNWSL